MAGTTNFTMRDLRQVMDSGDFLGKVRSYEGKIPGILEAFILEGTKRIDAPSPMGAYEACRARGNFVLNLTDGTVLTFEKNSPATAILVAITKK